MTRAEPDESDEPGRLGCREGREGVEAETSRMGRTVGRSVGRDDRLALGPLGHGTLLGEAHGLLDQGLHDP